jgi:hypothetical protein
MDKLTTEDLQDLRSAIYWAKDSILAGIDDDDPENAQDARDLVSRLTLIEDKLRRELYRRTP